MLAYKIPVTQSKFDFFVSARFIHFHFSQSKLCL